MIKAVFFDIDGTLMITKEKIVPKSAIEAIYKLKENGIQVFVATSRCDGEMGNFQEYLDTLPFDGLVSCGGAMLHYHGQTYSYPMSLEDSSRIVNYCLKHDIDLRYQTNDICALIKEPKKWVYDSFIHFYNYCPSIKEYQGEEVVNFLGFDNGLHYDLIMKELDNVDGVKFSDAFEMTKAGINKAFGITMMCAKLDITLDECMAFGDAENDCKMLEAAGIGVAMGNALEPAKKSANYITSSCDEDGIYNALKHFNLI